MATTSMVLACGHPPTDTDNAMLPGYAVKANGDRVCYRCAEGYELVTFLDKDTTSYVAYLSGNERAVTTWTGLKLATVTSCVRRRHNIGGFIYRLQAIDQDGGRWYGTSPGPSMYARLRRYKSSR